MSRNVPIAIVGTLFLSFQSPAADIGPFLEEHCVECHDSSTKKGGLNLEALQFDSLDRKQFETWVRIHDRIANGEMPPKKQERPPEADRAKILRVLDEKLHSTDTDVISKLGRARVRRLTAQEIENSLRDLLCLPNLHVKEALPEDERRHGYHKIGEALDLSNVHLAKIIDVVDSALGAAIATRIQPPPVYHKRFYPASGTETWLPIGRADAVLLKDKQFDPLCPLPDPEKRIQDNNAIDFAYQQERMKMVDGLGLRQYEGALGFFSGPVDKDFRRSLQFAPIHGGFYRIKTSAWSFWWDRGEVRNPIRPESFMLSVWLPEPGSRFDHSASRRIGMFDVPSLDSSVHEFTSWLDPDEELLFEIGTPTGYAPKTGRFPSSEPGSATTYSGPGIALDWFEVEGPLFSQWPPASHKALFGELPFKPFDSASGLRPPHRQIVKQIAVNARPRGAEISKEDTSPPLVTVSTEHPLEDASQLLSTFLPKAFRRAVDTNEIAQYVAITKQHLEAKSTFEEAMRETYKAALCSSDFLFVGEPPMSAQVESPNRLSDRALAERLSLWLWNTIPDDELRALASKGVLHETSILRAQVERMLADPRSDRFIQDFLDQWLDLRKLDASSPDRRTYPEYRAPLRESMPAETRAFFRELIDKNLSVTNLVASDFVMVNQGLAELYQIPGVTGSAIRRVGLPPGSPRGGFITQASVLKVTANGTTTSPVTRGVWMNERILGNPIPPPPPGVPAVEPDTRGTSTIREQLDKHRSDSACAACHAKIDPPGFALESFDVIGGFRDRYRSLGKGEANEVVFAAGWKPGYKLAKPVDAAGELPSGEPFKDITEFRDLLVRHPDSLAASFTRHLLMYATGSEPHYSDRREIAQIVERSRNTEYGLRSLIHEIAQSALFKNK
ncbi:MAG: DUF1592 domain-containing protein [Verrucomicrobiota bacterium]